MTIEDQRRTLMNLFDAAVAAANPLQCVPPALPDPPQDGRLIILGAGKGSAAMVQAAEAHYLGLNPKPDIVGCAVTRHGFALPAQAVEIIEGGHPVPDDGSAQAARRALEIAHGATEKDLVLVLLSGGASALWSAPVEGVTLAEKQQVTRGLLASGARISEINCVRKHLSSIKGGRLAHAAAPAKLVTLAISDVPGDDPSAIGSGPTVGDPTTLEDARGILEDRGIELPASVVAALGDARNETPQPDDASFAHAEYVLVSRPADALQAAASAAQKLGYEVRLLGDSIEGEARDVAVDHARLAQECVTSGKRTALLSGGEVTVTVTGSGRGGPNQEYALSLANELQGASGVSALAADTDGTDGGEGAADDPAGAIVDPTTAQRAAGLGLNPAKFLINNDSTGFFRALDDLLVTGPTRTNVNDFRVILIDC
ncbi:MAG: glycerate kinase [Pseudomonadota bacterium]